MGEATIERVCVHNEGRGRVCVPGSLLPSVYRKMVPVSFVGIDASGKAEGDCW